MGFSHQATSLHFIADTFYMVHGTDRHIGVRRQRGVSNGSVLLARIVSGDVNQQRQVKERLCFGHSTVQRVQLELQ